MVLSCPGETCFGAQSYRAGLSVSRLDRDNDFALVMSCMCYYFSFPLHFTLHPKGFVSAVVCGSLNYTDILSCAFSQDKAAEARGETGRCGVRAQMSP